MRRRTLPIVQSITDVAERQLCTGCGVCAFVQPGDIEMVDDLDAGRRPLVRRGPDGEPSTAAALAGCPGVGLAHTSDPPGAIEGVRTAWGPVLEVWEGYATDDEIRFAGSSGGAASALALHSIRHEEMHGVLHIRARKDVPYLNETVMSTTRGQIVEATGSRYAPASPCDRLDLVRDAPAPCVFIGKPCDVAATAKVRAVDPRLDEQLGLTIAIFCAGTPSARGTLEMLEKMGIHDPSVVANIRYRGLGWPGKARARTTEDQSDDRELTYDESWGQVLERHRQWRCYVCADHTGEFADIAVGDPWYREIEPDEPGRSLIVVRSDRGRRLLHAALSSGHLTARRVDAERIAASQPGLLRVRGALWGRTVASRLAGIPVPRYRGLPTFPVWLRSLSLGEKLRSIVGLWRRIGKKGLRRRHPVRPVARGAPSASEDNSGLPGTRVEVGSHGASRRSVLAVVVTHNSAEEVGGLLSCLPEALGDESSWTIAVVDNASTDDTLEIAARAEPRAVLHQCEVNGGYAAGINAGVAAHPEHDTIVVLNADVRLEPNSIEPLATLLDKELTAIVAPRLVNGAGDLIYSIRREPTLRGCWLEAIAGGRIAGRVPGAGQVVTDPTRYEHAAWVDWASGPMLAFSRASFDLLGGWDESFFLYSEETDYCLRARDLGLKTLFTPKVTATHHEGDSTTSPFLWSLLIRNRYALFRRRNGDIRSGLYWLGLVVREAIRSRERVHAAALRALLRPSGLAREVATRRGSTTSQPANAGQTSS